MCFTLCSQGGSLSTKRLAKEARIWSELRDSEDVQQKNILPILGYFIGTDDYFNVISEYMPNGTLAEYRHLVHRGEGTLRVVSGRWGVRG